MRQLNLLIISSFLMFSHCKKKESKEEKNINQSDVYTSVTKEFSFGEKGNRQVYFDFDKEVQLPFVEGEKEYSNFSLIEGNYPVLSGGSLNITKNLPQKDILEGWDIIFTKYTDVYKYEGIEYVYEPTGVLSNVLNNVEILRINDDKYENIMMEDIKVKSFSKEYNEIGYNWKDFTTVPSVHFLVENLYFVIKTDRGNYYKMKFLDFQVEKFTIKNVQIEYQKL